MISQLKSFYRAHKKGVHKHFKAIFWFSTGILLGIFFIAGFGLVIFREAHKNVVFPGITVEGVNLGGKTKEEVKNYFVKKNERVKNIKLVFEGSNEIATLSAKELSLGYDDNLIAEQVFSIGRTDNIFSNITLATQAYISGLDIPASFKYDEEKLLSALTPLFKSINSPAEDAVFKFENGKVTAFKLSKNGQEVDTERLTSNIKLRIFSITEGPKQQYVLFSIPINVITPKVTSDKVNNLGIKELIGKGTSLFQHSIINRVYNVSLASARINGSLVAPGEVFSFNKALGDVSAFTGYKQAYDI